jgi:hypothetical protein
MKMEDINLKGPPVVKPELRYTKAAGGGTSSAPDDCPTRGTRRKATERASVVKKRAYKRHATRQSEDEDDDRDETPGHTRRRNLQPTQHARG